MESFFLAETTKYLYLLFDEHNFIHQSNGSVDQQIKATQSPSCNPGSAGYIFNTEAHPIDIGAIHCCSPSRMTYIPEELFRTRDMLIENSQELNYESNEDLNDEEDVEKTFTAAYTWKRCLHLLEILSVRCIFWRKWRGTLVHVWVNLLCSGFGMSCNTQGASRDILKNSWEEDFT